MAPGSRLGFDLPNTLFLTHPRMLPMLDQLAAAGAPWRYGHDDPAALLAPLGFAAEVRQPSDDDCHHGRWDRPPLPLSVPYLRTWLVTSTRVV